MILFSEDEELNGVLNTVYNKAVEDTLLSIPKFLLAYMQNAAHFVQVKTEFFEANPDMLDNKLFLQQLSSLEPVTFDKDYNELLSEAAEVTRKMKGSVGDAGVLSNPEEHKRRLTSN